MITIYQIRLTDAEIDAVNSGVELEKYHVRTRMMFGFNKSKFSEDYLQHYTAVYTVDTDDLDQAFESTNLWEDDLVTRLSGPAASTSVGDIFVMENGDAFVCDTFGFVAIGKYGMMEVA